MTRASRRTLGHALIGTLSAGAALALWGVLEGDASKPPLFAASMASGYVGLALLCICLAIGPLRVLRRAGAPVHIDLRRDVGFWAAGFGLLHCVIGLQVHMVGRMQLYFVRDYWEGGPLLPRIDPFGVANFTGLAATLLLVLLAGISNDRMLRKLGAQRWKAWQRSSYPLGLAVLAHALAYQFVEQRALPLVALTCVLTGATAVLQWRGFRARRPASPSPPH